LLTVSTPGALAACRKEGTNGLEYLRRHVTGDWGDLCDENKAENQLAVKEGFRILSAYRLPRTGVKFWIELSRSAAARKNAMGWSAQSQML